MFYFIPVEYYRNTHYLLLLLFVLFIFTYCNFVFLDTKIKFNRIIFRSFSLFYLIFLVLYIGLRPVNEIFVDMIVYNYIYEQITLFGLKTAEKDLFFYIYMYLCSLIMSANMFFLLTTMLYIIPICILSYKLFNRYWFYSFLSFVVSFSFLAYGTNTIRAGMAGSILLLVFVFKYRIIKIFILWLAFGIHASMLVPIIAYFLACFFKNTKIVVMSWISTIIFSLSLGDFFQHFFSRFIIDDRASYLTIENTNTEIFSSIGFRWDFILYSAMPVVLGYFFIFYKNFQDEIYKVIYRMYVIANGVWILVIYANFSDRFAYLSWFIMPLVVIYPFLCKSDMKKQHQKIGWIILLTFSFTFFMNVILPYFK